MKKTKLFLSFLLLAATGAFAQVGIGTTNPQGVFNVDAGKDNATTGTPTTSQQANDVTILSSGFVGIGRTAPTSVLDISSTNGTITNTRYTTTSTVGASLLLQKSNSATHLANGAVADAGLIGRIQFKGNQGSGYNGATNAEINAIQIGTSSTSNAGGKIEFGTSASGDVSGAQVRVTIGDDGNVGIGITSPTKALDLKTADEWGGITVTNTEAIATTGAAQFILKGTHGWAWQSNSSGNGNGNGYLQLVDNDSANAVRLSVAPAGNMGIGVNAPDNSAILEVKSTTKGFLPPRVTKTQRDAIATPATGSILYCTDCNAGSGCMQINDGTSAAPSWNCIGSGGSVSSSVTAVCNGFATGTYSNNSAIAGTYTVTITNNSFSSITVPVASTNLVLSGVTASPALAVGTPTASPNAVVSGNVTIASGTSATITYPITGTPTTAGTLTGTWTIQTLTCSATKTVSAITIPTSITLGQTRIYMLASVFDQDYLPYTTPTGAATTSAQAADGTNEATTVNVQGTITTAGVNFKIPVTATGSGTLPAFSTTISVPASMTQDGVARDLTLSWASQAYTNTDTFIAANIKSVGGTLNAKKLDINAGIGNDVLGVLIGTFNYPYNNAGNTTTYAVRIISGIPDRKFGLADNSGAGSESKHNFLYLPIVGEDGNTWLNNNLGALYSHVATAGFNLSQQATSATDHKAYGSLYQWGRKTDGHELMTWNSGTDGAPVNGTSATLNNNPTTTDFITATGTPSDWRTTQDATLWATEASANNPCPSGFRVPTSTEYTALVTAAAIIDNVTSYSNTTLKFTNSNFRNGADGSINPLYSGTDGVYWSSTTTGTKAYIRYFTAGQANQYAYDRNFGMNVRCIKN